MEQINLWELLAGLGIFLFGMFLMEEAIKNLSGREFKKFIRNATKGRLKSVLAGTFTTAILQSSTAVSFMVLAFAGAGIMSMSDAIGVILGSNIGTTLTSWVVATIGFKVNIEKLALPFIGLGGIGLILFGKSQKAINIFKLLIGFGFLFMGLDYMKNSIESLTQIIDIKSLAEYGLPMFLLAGFVLTAIIQSSTAAMAIILSAVHSGLLGFPSAVAMVIGTNIGTTVTILIGTIGAVPIKKRVAYSHFFFNIITAIIVFLLLPLILYLFDNVFHLSQNPVIGIAIFHTLFNVSGVIFFFPFIGLFAKLISKLVKEKKSAITLYLNKISAEEPEAAINALKKESHYLLELVVLHNLRIFNISKSGLNINLIKEIPDNKILKYTSEDLYILIKLLQAEIFSFASNALTAKLFVAEVEELNKILSAVRFAVSSAKTLKDIKPDIEELYTAENEFLYNFYLVFRNKTDENYNILIQVLNDQNVSHQIPALLKLRESFSKVDTDFISELTEGIGRQQVSDISISNLLASNRGILISTRQIILSLRDLLFNKEQIMIFENFEDEAEFNIQLDKTGKNEPSTEA